MKGFRISTKKKTEQRFHLPYRTGKNEQAPEQLESGTIMGGFAHEAALSVADKIIDAVKTGKISRFMVMAGCDGRHKEGHITPSLQKPFQKTQ